MSNIYITALEYKRATTGQEITTLLGNLLRLSSAVSANGVALPTPATTVALNQYDIITIFDGSNSEQVEVTANTPQNSTSIPVSALQFSHAAGTLYCSDGTLGSLGEAIFIASATVESICEQPLLQATYAEDYTLRTPAAVINSDLQLWVRPRRFPVTAVSALSIETSVGDTITLDPAQAIIGSTQRLISVPVISALGSGGSLLQLRPPVDQTSSGFVNLTYTSGFVYTLLPWDIKQAAIWLTSDVLSDRLNSTGAAEYQVGSVRRTAFLRGDLTGDSALYKRAVSRLELYRRQK